MYGFHGAYLRIDLTRDESTRIPLDPGVLRAHLGGVGLGAWLLDREAPVGVDPLAPEAPIVLAFSPLVGTPLTTSAKFAVVAKSPLTGMLSDGLSSSDFALAGKAMGVDAIVIVGRCAEPSIWRAGRLEATDQWGASAADTERALAGTGRVIAIGIAGENGVRFASLSNGGRHAGRGGIGAVMGAKRLKALVVAGDVATQLADPARVRAQALDLARRSLGEATAKYRELGTLANLPVFDRLGVLPTRNFQSGRFDGIARLVEGGLAAGHGSTRQSCARCTIGCEHRYAAADGSTARVEYESAFALGPLCGIDDPAAVVEAIGRCDALGLDTISAGGTIAFAMECGERGWLADGPRFGDARSLLASLDAIAARRGVGDLLAEGSRRAALRIGRGALAIAAQVKGLEMPGYEPRGLHAQALGFAVGTRGADHNRSSAYEIDFSEKADRLHGDSRTALLTIESEDRAALIDSLILCKFLRGAFADVYAESAELLEAVTGMDFSAAELRDLATRVVTLRKRFNVREGWKPADDSLPDRFFDEAVESPGAPTARLSRERLGEMIRAYYVARGWSPDGYPPLPREREDAVGAEADAAGRMQAESLRPEPLG